MPGIDFWFKCLFKFVLRRGWGVGGGGKEVGGGGARRQFHAELIAKATDPSLAVHISSGVSVEIFGCPATSKYLHHASENGLCESLLCGSSNHIVSILTKILIRDCCISKWR